MYSACRYSTFLDKDADKEVGKGLAKIDRESETERESAPTAQTRITETWAALDDNIAFSKQKIVTAETLCGTDCDLAEATEAKTTPTRPAAMASTQMPSCNQPLSICQPCAAPRR